ncbi:MAG: hypothetical protein QGH80_05115 [Acidimicrobiales bacterium]|nr:hypothetical protein [Acidimicrobiales bacterium]
MNAIKLWVSSRPGNPTIATSLWLLNAATAAASALQAPHHGAQNHKSTSRPAKDEGTNASPEIVGRSRTVKATGTPAPTFSTNAEVSTLAALD